jgi:hypothetical protein
MSECEVLYLVCTLEIEGNLFLGIAGPICLSTWNHSSDHQNFGDQKWLPNVGTRVTVV